MQVEVVRRGGLMGLALRGTVETADLPEAVAGQAEAALAGLRYGGEAASPAHPDGFRYELVVVQDGERRCAQLDEAELPEPLRPLVKAALGRPAAG